METSPPVILSDLDVMSGASAYSEWILSGFEPYLGRRILEVGAGTGNMTRHLLGRELVVAVDLEEACCRAITERFGDLAGVRVICGDCGSPDLLEGLREQRLDTVLAVNILEHITDDLEAVRAFARILERGGALCIFVPAFQSLYGPADRRVGHLRRYRRADVVGLLRGAGLEVEEARYFNLPGFLAWWLMVRLLGQDGPKPGQIGVYDKMVVPPARTLERLVQPPFGQSVLAVGRKRP